MLLHFSYSQHCLEFLPCRKVSISPAEVSPLLGWAKAQNLQALWEKPAACPPQGGKGILALLPLADDDSSKRKRNDFYLASKLPLAGYNCCLLPIAPCNKSSFRWKNKNPTKNPAEDFERGFHVRKKERELFRLQAGRKPSFIKRIREAVAPL